MTPKVIQKAVGQVWETIGDFCSLNTLLALNQVFHFTTEADIEFHCSAKSAADQVSYALRSDKHYPLDSKQLSIYALLLNRAREFPDHPEHSRIALITLIRKHQKEKRELEMRPVHADQIDSDLIALLNEMDTSLVFHERARELKEALEMEGLELRSDSAFFEAYIKMTTTACKEEVVAIEILNRSLLEFDEQILSECHEDFCEDLDNLVFTGCIPEDSDEETDDLELPTLPVGCNPPSPSKDRWIPAALALTRSEYFTTMCECEMEEDYLPYAYGFSDSDDSDEYYSDEEY